MMARRISIGLLALLFVAAGINHFVHPEFYVGIMPPYLPWPRFLVALSGVIEILLGIAVAVPATRRTAGWMLIAMLVAFIPVHIHMAMHPDQFPDIAWWKILLRLPVQAFFIGWVAWAAVASTQHHRCETIQP